MIEKRKQGNTCLGLNAFRTLWCNKLSVIAKSVRNSFLNSYTPSAGSVSWQQAMVTCLIFYVDWNKYNIVKSEKENNLKKIFCLLQTQFFFFSWNYNYKKVTRDSCITHSTAAIWVMLENLVLEIVGYVALTTDDVHHLMKWDNGKNIFYSNFIISWFLNFILHET